MKKVKCWFNIKCSKLVSNNIFYILLSIKFSNKGILKLVVIINFI